MMSPIQSVCVGGGGGGGEGEGGRYDGSKNREEGGDRAGTVQTVKHSEGGHRCHAKR
jgi:hypothetical protein